MNQYVIAAIQMCTNDDRERNLHRVEEMTEEAVARGAKLVALPEVMNVASEDSILFPPECIDGDTIQRMGKLAEKHGIFLHCGSIREAGPGGKRYNASVLLNPKGEVAAVYRKLHLFDVQIENGPCVRESERDLPGGEIVAADTELGRLGFTICYDMRFPELYRLLSLEGAQVIFVPANFTKPTGEAHWHILLRARAIENNCYIVAPAQSGSKPHFEAYGHSVIIDPWGNILAELPLGEGVITAQIDLDMVEKMRSQLGSLQNRRADLYDLQRTKE